jgi:hypothetical protein
MMPITVDWEWIRGAINASKDVTITAALWLVLVGGALQKWVWGHHYAELRDRLAKCEAQNEWLLHQLTEALTMTDRAVGLVETRTPR